MNDANKNHEIFNRCFRQTTTDLHYLQGSRGDGDVHFATGYMFALMRVAMMRELKRDVHASESNRAYVELKKWIML